MNNNKYKLKHKSYTTEDITTSLTSLYNVIKMRIKKKTQTSSSKETKENSLDSSTLNPFALINYIKESIDVLNEIAINEQVDEYIHQHENNKQQEYESILIKYEKDIRGHIRVQHQLKLYADNLQSENEQNERKRKELLDVIAQYKKTNQTNANVIMTYEKEIQNLKNEINNLKHNIKVLQDNEHKYKNEITHLNDKVNTLNTKLSLYEIKSTTNINVNANNNTGGYIPKRVIGAMPNQFNKRNKNFSFSGNNVMNNSVNNYFNYNMLDPSSRLISKQSDLNKNRSVGNFNKKNYNKIHLIKDMLLKNSNVSRDESAQNKSMNMIIPNVNGNDNNSSHNNRMSNNNSNSNTMMYHHVNGNSYAYGRVYGKHRKGDNRKITSSLIISKTSNSYVNNKINMLTSSPKKNQNEV